jgi:hypothetical protein
VQGPLQCPPAFIKAIARGYGSKNAGTVGRADGFCLPLTHTHTQPSHALFAVTILLLVLLVAVWTTVDLSTGHAAAKRESLPVWVDARTSLALSLLANVPGRMVEAEEQWPGLRWCV